MHKYEHARVDTPAAAEIYELGMCSVLPTDFVPVLRSDAFVCPVLYYAYKYVLVILNFDSTRGICTTGYVWLSVL